jgi:hypothetical protein
MTETVRKLAGSASDKVGGSLGGEMDKLRSAVMQRIGSEATNRLGSLTDRLTEFSSGDGSVGSFKKAAGSKAGEALASGESPVKAALSAGASGLKEKVSGIFGGGKGGGGGKSGKKLKVTNIIEEIDVGAPIDLVYNQWTQFQDFSGFMKKVENVDQKEDTDLTFKAQVLWSHRQWEGHILEQVPNERIIWRSKGQKGHVDGAVTFHELAPDLTRVLIVLEYYPQGLFERTGNLWRAQGRRARLELKHFRRHVMTEVLLHPDDIEGWRGEIHDGKVEVSDEDARKREQEASDSDDDENENDEDENDENENDENENDENEESDESDDEMEDDDRQRQRRRGRSRGRGSDDGGRSQREGRSQGRGEGRGEGRSDGRPERRRRNDRPRQRGERDGQSRRRAGSREQ